MLKILFRIIKWSALVILTLVVIIFLISYYNIAHVPGDALNKAEQYKPYDVIIVPGVPYNEDGWSRIMKARVIWSKYLYDEGYTKNIIYSGSAVYSPYIEAEIMKMYGEALGIPAENIFTEPNAEHSTENLFYSYNLARKLGFNKIALATDPLQSLMLSGLRKKMDPQMGNMPVSFKKLKMLPQDDHDIDPAKAYVEGFVSIIEREGIWERLKGTFGKKVNLEK